MEINGETFELGKGIIRKEATFYCPIHGEFKRNWMFKDGEPIGEPICSKCQEEEDRRAKESQRENDRQTIIRYALIDAGVPDINLDNRFDNFVPGSEQLASNINVAKDFSESEYIYGLVMFGSRGSGKTHLAVSIMVKFLFGGNGKRKARYITASSLLRDFRSAMNAKRGGVNENMLMDMYTDEYDLLVMDELGRYGNTEYSNEIIQEIISTRLEHGKKTILITNSDFKTLRELIGEHNVSRLKACGKSLAFNEPDYRDKLRNIER